MTKPQRSTKSNRSVQKRSNGEGSIERVGKKWRWRYTVGRDKATGQPVRIGGTCNTKTEALETLVKARADDARGVLVLPSAMTVAEYAERWLDQQKDIETSTSGNYKTVLNYAIDEIGSMKLADVRAFHVKDALVRLSERTATRGLGAGRTLASRTLTQIRGRLKAMFRSALDDELIARDPAANVKPVKVMRTEHPGIALDFDEADYFVELGESLYAAGICRLWPALFTALTTALRRGELLGLTWEHVDLEAQTLAVRANLTLTNGKPLLKNYLKTEAGKREVYIQGCLRTLLQEHQRRQTAELALLGLRLLPHTPVFATSEGKLTHPDNLGRALRDLLEWCDLGETNGTGASERLETRLRRVAVGDRDRIRAAVLGRATIPRITPHHLRHTCGTLWLRAPNSVPVEVVSKWMGHEDINVTLKVYRHVLKSESREYRIEFFPRS